MRNFTLKLQKFEFQNRIFISFGIVLFICFLSFLVFKSFRSNLIIIGEWFSIESNLALRFGYIIIAFIMVIASTLRMWAGSILTSQRIMSFKIQNDNLTTSGPYLLVRNPIYLADLIAFLGFALCLKSIGLALPILLYFHYTQLVKYEEQSLKENFGEPFQKYLSNVPRFFPKLSSPYQFRKALKDFHINFDGFRHNGLYFLFIAGFIVAAFTNSLAFAIIIGLPAVIDWAIVHTCKGILPKQPVQSKNFDAQSKVLDDILYAQCWEDPQIDREAFNIGPEDIVFSITSGGCNVLAFLLDNPSKIIALDISPNQNYLLELKMAAFKSLNYDELLEFLGVNPSKRGLELYTVLQSYLSKECQKYWNKQQSKINTGIIHTGRYEGYMHLLSKWFCRVMGKSIIEEFFATESSAEREILYQKKWNNLRWRFFTRLLLSRAVMTLLFDKAFFAQLEGSFSFGEHFNKLIKRAVVELPLRENNFMSYILLGHFYNDKYLPVYLRSDNFEIIRSRLDRIEIVSNSCEDYFASLPANSISKFNFTNIFEWMSQETFEKLLRETIRVAKDGAIITYRNLLVPRSRPESLAQWIESLHELSRNLHQKDLSFVYKTYIVERINKQ